MMILSTVSFSQHAVSWEVNSGTSQMQSYPSGLIEVGEVLVTIDATYGNNFNQSELKVYDKSEGNLLFSEILSSSFDDYFSIVEGVEIGENTSDYIFVINKSAYDPNSSEQINSSLIYRYNSDELTLENTLSDTQTSILIYNSIDLLIIDATNYNINKLSTTDYSILETTPVSFENTDFTSPKIFKLNDNNFLIKGNINAGSNNNDVFLSKFDLNAEIFWENVIDGNRNDYINKVITINDEIYLCGKSLSYDGIFEDQYGDGIEFGDEPFKTNWIMKLDTDGDIVWNKLLNPSYNQQNNGQFFDIYDGNSFIIVSGSSYNTYNYHSSYESVYNEDVYSVKLDLNGNVIWENTYGGFNNQVFGSIEISNNQIIYTTNLNRWNFFGIGGGFSSQGDVTAEENGKFNYFASTNQNDIWVFATDFEGEIQWNQFYGGEKYENISYTVYNSDAVYGYASTESSGNDVGELIGNRDSWLFKLEVNDPPVAVDDSYSLAEDSDLTNIDVTENDTDNENDVLSIISISYSGSGITNINADGVSIDYTPEADFNGTEDVTYTVSDGNTSDIGVLNITVTPVNDAPVSVNDIIELNEGGLITILQNNELSLLHNDSDIDEDDLSTFIVDSPLYGELGLNLDGTFSYQHDGSETTSDSFTYKSNDGDLDSNISTVTIIINPVNDNSPSNISISNNSIEENISNATVGQLSTTDLDLPSDSHSFELISGEGDNGNDKFSIDGSNLNLITSLDYESESNHSVRIRVIDENDNSYEDSITINVIDVNDISITSEVTDSYCSDNSGTGSITITSINNVTGNVSFSWSSENGGIIPSGQENNQNLSDLTSGTYTLDLSNNDFNFIQQFEVGISDAYNELTICYVSSDEVNTSNNRIFLNNIGNYNVDYFEILRETNIADNYESIGQIQSSENSFLDESSNNMSQTYTYKVRSIDYCGESSENSDEHKTILLQSSVAINNSVNLNWSDYEGTNYQSYDIYRNKNDEGFELIGSVSTNNNSYTDSTADISQNSYEYYISITVDDCLTQSRNSSEIKSNLQNIGSSLTTGEDISSKWLSIYPNPTSDIVYIDGNYTQLKVVVYDILGKQVINKSITNSIDISKLEKGVYILQLSDGAKVTTQRIIKN